MDVRHDETRCLFLVETDGCTAYVEYEIHDGKLDILHTIVPKAIGGRGIASVLVQTAYDYARANNLRPYATCSYAVAWLLRHPDYQK
ncbi:GNAT family N-acetyltransferase [uncultured Bacteroides sp.]|uniref:GNAT family N-acetyltransferase n=1 Tax=uncultured Bacteroides sp. TaxID=162156 RepID=UPI002622EB85|nr:GNAT family N-acetyltransferase [uncultured Bacteroides sp.]